MANEREAEASQELAGKVQSKIKEIIRLAQDMEVDFANSLSSNDYQLCYIEQAERVIDEILSSLKSGAVMIC